MATYDPSSLKTQTISDLLVIVLVIVIRIDSIDGNSDTVR